MPAKLTLTRHGQPIAQHTLHSAAPLRIPAQDNVYYQLEQAQQVQALRSGDDLLVSIDGSLQLVVEDYFLLDDSGLQNPLLGLQPNGQYSAYPIDAATIHDSAPLLAQSVAPSAAGTAADTPLALGIGALAGLGILGLAGAAVNSGNDGRPHTPKGGDTPDQPRFPLNPEPPAPDNPSENPQVPPVRPNPQPAPDNPPAPNPPAPENPQPVPTPPPASNTPGQAVISGTAKAGHTETPVSRFTGAVLPENSVYNGNGIAPPAADAPVISLAADAPASIKEGESAVYAVVLDKPADRDVSADIKIIHQSSAADDAAISWHWQRVTVKAGDTRATFQVETRTDGQAEGAETFSVELGNAVYGTVNAENTPFSGSVDAQSVFMVSHKYPLAQANTDIYSDYWQAVFDAGSSKIPFVLINPNAGTGEKIDPGWTKAVEKSTAEGFQNIAYIRTNQQTRDIDEVKAEIDRYIKFYGGKNLHGFWFDEISSLGNAGTAYMAEVYNYVKNTYGNKLVLANPGTHITDLIAPYADIWVTNESTLGSYDQYQIPKSAFENDPANAERIMHIVYDVPQGEYQRVIDVTRGHNAGWVFISSDSISPDGRPYNDLPQDFAQLVDDINNLGAPSIPGTSRPQNVLSGANIGTDSATTTIIDADTPAAAPKPAPTPAAEAGYTRLAFADEFDSVSTIDTQLTGKEGFLRYPKGPWGRKDTTPDEYSVQDGYLTLDPTHRNFNYNFSTRDFVTGAGQSFSHGYYEARMRWEYKPDVIRNTVGMNTGDDCYSWPAFWGTSHRLVTDKPPTRIWNWISSNRGIKTKSYPPCGIGRARMSPK